MAIAIAIIENLDERHHLIVLDESMCQEVRDLIGDDDAPMDVADEIASMIRQRLHLRDQDVAVVDTEGGVTDAWPSTGQADSWPDDVWLGLADYLSYREWTRLAGRRSEYLLTDEDAESCVRNSGADEVEDALGYLTEADAIYAPLRKALMAFNAVNA